MPGKIETEKWIDAAPADSIAALRGSVARDLLDEVRDFISEREAKRGSDGRL